MIKDNYDFTKHVIDGVSFLTAIGTFLVTTDPIFHYGKLFERAPIDSTKIGKTIPKAELDSLTTFTTDALSPTIRQLDRKQRLLEKKIIEHDTIIYKRILGE